MQEITVGFWYNLYKGDLGRLRVGAQYEFIQLTGFPGAPGASVGTSTPNLGINPNEQVVFVSVRYYPFN
jgi:hypothetical protein